MHLDKGILHACMCVHVHSMIYVLYMVLWNARDKNILWDQRSKSLNDVAIVVLSARLSTQNNMFTTQWYD